MVGAGGVVGGEVVVGGVVAGGPAAVAAEPTVASSGNTQPIDPIRRFAIRWGIVFGVILFAFFGVVTALNSTLYSAQGFVSSYLDALARHDVDEALSTPGVVLPDDAADDLLTPAALGDVDRIHLVSDTVTDGTHLLEYEFELNGTSGRTEFTVEPTGTRLGFFSTWTFATSPTTVLEVTPVNDARFEANGIAIVSPTGPSVTTRYAVLTPGVFALGHDSAYLIAEPADILVLQPDVTVRAEVTPRANPEFVELVQSELDGLLDDCATQEVLQPTGCPFGESINNRIEGTPTWSMSAYPVITIVPGATPGTWEVPETPGAAHLVVEVRSLFDGTVSTFDQDVAFTVSYLI